MVLFPPAKINLGLQIVRLRPDGYRDISSGMYALPLTDVLEILPGDGLEFHPSGLPIPGENTDNLVLRAWHLMHERYRIAPVRIYLRKQIPMGAGLGGGSADAAYTLRGLNELFQLNLSNNELRSLAAELGSDCAFFIEDRPQLAEGRGEILSPLSVDLSGFFVKLIHPEIHVSTAMAYAGVEPKEATVSIREIVKHPVDAWKGLLQNDFEDSIFASFPKIAHIKEEMYREGAVYASMSGSGSSVFGLYKSAPKKSPEYTHSWVLQL